MWLEMGHGMQFEGSRSLPLLMSGRHNDNVPNQIMKLQARALLDDVYSRVSLMVTRSNHRQSTLGD